MDREHTEGNRSLVPDPWGKLRISKLKVMRFNAKQKVHVPAGIINCIRRRRIT